MIPGLALVFTIGLHQEHRAGDRWLGADKVKHFVTAAFVQSASFSALRAVRVERGAAFVGSTAVAAAASVGKEIRDARRGGKASARDLTWDGAGMAAAAALLRRTER